MLVGPLLFGSVLFHPRQRLDMNQGYQCLVGIKHRFWLVLIRHFVYECGRCHHVSWFHLRMSFYVAITWSLIWAQFMLFPYYNSGHFLQSSFLVAVSFIFQASLRWSCFFLSQFFPVFFNRPLWWRKSDLCSSLWTPPLSYDCLYRFNWSRLIQVDYD